MGVGFGYMLVLVSVLVSVLVLILVLVLVFGIGGGVGGSIWRYLAAFELAASGIICGIWDDLAASGSIWAGSTWHHLAPSGLPGKAIRAMEPGKQEKALFL